MRKPYLAYNGSEEAASKFCALIEANAAHLDDQMLTEWIDKLDELLRNARRIRMRSVIS